LKGNSAMMGLTPLQGLAHVLEDLVGLLGREGEARSAGAPLLVRGAGLLADLVRGVTAGPLPDGAAEQYQEEARAFLAAERGRRAAPAPGGSRAAGRAPRVIRRGDERAGGDPACRAALAHPAPGHPRRGPARPGAARAGAHPQAAGGGADGAAAAAALDAVR